MYELIFCLWKEIAPRVERRRSRRKKNAANVDLAWHFYACCEPCVAPASTGDSEWWPDWKCSRQQRKSDMQAKHCGGHFYPPARANLSDLLCFSHLLQQTLCWVMAWQNTAKGSHFSPPVLSGWKEVTARKLRFLRPCCWQLLCPSRVSVEIVSEIWREERACLYLPTPMSHSGEWAIWTGPQWTEQTGREWWHFLFNKKCAVVIKQMGYFLLYLNSNCLYAKSF